MKKEKGESLGITDAQEKRSNTIGPERNGEWFLKPKPSSGKVKQKSSVRLGKAHR